jgi:hypothetical protein
MVLAAAAAALTLAAPQGGGIAWVNGAGPHALFSVEFHPLDQAASHYVAPQIVAPAAPTGIRAVQVGKYIRVSWSRVDDATVYEVRRGGRLIAKVTATSCVARRPGKRPTYSVRAMNAAGTSP